MSITIKPHLLISHLLPGCFFLILFSLDYNSWNIKCLKDSLRDLNATELIGLGVILLIAAFLLGEIFDSTRDGIGEWLLDKIEEVNWDFFNNATEDKLTRLETNYFTWYVFNFNTAISLLTGSIVTLFFVHAKAISSWLWVALGLSIFVLGFDAWQLRKEIVKHTK